MKASFSIEWMAQSSQATSPQHLNLSHQATEPTACGTNSESLPGFYCRQQPSASEESCSAQEAYSGFNSAQEAYSSSSSLLHPTSHTAQQTEADFSSGTEEETSGYESEEGRSLSPAVPADAASVPSSPPSGRRPRTAFTAEQINSLEQAFKRNAYLGTQDKAELCKKLNLSDKQIRNWFQNRRMKLKRTVQDALAHACQANVASHFMQYSELQTYRASPYPRFHSATPDPSLSATPFVHTQGLQYPPALSAGMSQDSLYQYGSLPTVMLPSSAAPLMGSYPSYPPYY